MQSGISALSKRWSSRECPAKCLYCRRLCHVIASKSSGIFVSEALFLIVVLVVAAGAQSWLLAMSGLCLTVAHNLWAWKRAELTPIPEESAKAARAVNWILWGFYALFAIFSS